MIGAALLASLSAMLGGAIALAARNRPALLERTRTFAFAAAAGVVAFHLLPDVLPEEGLTALLWMAAGFALPWALEAGTRAFAPRLLRNQGFSGMRISAEVGFVALIFHSVVEGLTLVAALAEPGRKLDLEIAIVAHHAPLTAAVVLPFLDVKGPRAAGSRALLVAAAGLAGALLSGLVPGLGRGALLHAATAATAGVLLHVVADEIRAQPFGSGMERALDFGACLAGLAVAGLAALVHVREEAAPLLEFVHVLWGVFLACAPALLFGSIVLALLASRTGSFRWDALLLMLALLGPASAMAWAAGTVLVWLATARGPRAPAAPAPFAAELVSIVRRRAPPLLALLMAAAGLEVSAETFPGSLPAVAALALAIVLAARLDEAGAVAVAAVLVHKGIDPGIAVALLVFGPLTRAAVVRALGRPARASAALTLGCAATLGVGKALSTSGALAPAQAAASRALEGVRGAIGAQAIASPFAAAAALVLLALALLTLWSEGVRGWFAPLRHGPRAV